MMSNFWEIIKASHVLFISLLNVFFYIALGFFDIFVDFTLLDFKQKFMNLAVNKQTNKQKKKTIIKKKPAKI